MIRDRIGRHRRHGRLHGAGTDSRSRVRQPRRHLRAWCDPLRAAHRATGVRSAVTGRRRSRPRCATIRCPRHRAPTSGLQDIIRIVQRCLEKEADARFQSAADLAFALETVIGEPRHDHADDRSGARRYALTISIAAALLLGVGGRRHDTLAHADCATDGRPARALLYPRRLTCSLHGLRRHHIGWDDHCLLRQRGAPGVATALRSPHRSNRRGHIARNRARDESILLARRRVRRLLGRQRR